MADPRLANHQQFDILRCKLCNRLYEDPRLLPCLHSFCLACLHSHVVSECPSASDMCCPLCQEVAPLPESGELSDLPKNTLITKSVQQAQRDATVVVAGREVMEMQRQALTQSEQQCPVITANMQKIADTASLVIAHGTSELSEVHGFDTVKARQELQVQIADAQDRSLKIVYAIDQVNQDLDQWQQEKDQVKQRIKHRSQTIQNMVKNIELRLLAKLDDNNQETKMKDECFRVKTQLHKILKSGMTFVDFVKLLAEFGNKQELEHYTDMVDSRESKLTKTDLTLTRNMFTFDSPTMDLQEALEMMFGTLSEITEETTVWDPHKSKLQHVPMSHQANNQLDISEIHDHDEMQVRASPLLFPHNSEESEIHSHYTPKIHEDHGVRFAKRFESSSPQKTRRRPLKSMSFDTGTSYSSFLARKMEAHSEDVSQSDSHSQSHNHERVHFEESVQMQGDLERHTDSSESSHSSSESGPVSSAIQRLSESSRFSRMADQRDWLRRLSAPSAAISDLSRRRLSALSILEKANISTQGLDMTNHVESGLSEARLEWLRENVRTRSRTKLSERSISMDSGQF